MSKEDVVQISNELVELSSTLIGNSNSNAMMNALEKERKIRRIVSLSFKQYCQTDDHEIHEILDSMIKKETPNINIARKLYKKTSISSKNDEIGKKYDLLHNGFVQITNVMMQTLGISVEKSIDDLLNSPEEFYLFVDQLKNFQRYEFNNENIPPDTLNLYNKLLGSIESYSKQSKDEYQELVRLSSQLC